MSKCNCSTMARTWVETHGGKYPHSEHSPACAEFKLKHYAVVDDGNSEVVIKISEVSEWLADCCINKGGSSPTVKLVTLTKDQFNRMKEFEG